jgi:2-dehydropantoate 2-reductase
MIEPKLKVGIIGAGSMGTLFGYHLADACEVTMLDRNADLLASIERDGLCVNDAAPRRVTTARNASQLFGSSVLFLFVKAVDTLNALRPFAGQLNPATPIVSLQNGVGNEDAIKTALGGAVPIVLGITTESSLSTGPGRARSSEAGNTILGSGGAAPETSKRMAGLLAQSGLRASVVYDIRPHLWGKLVANAAINAISALLDCDAGAIPADANAAHLAQAIAREAATVAAGMRINLPFNDPWQYVTEVIAVGADSKSSMAFDLEMGHPTEIDHINGAVVAAGRRIGVSTPYNDAIVRLIKAKETMLKMPVRATT